MKQHVLISIFLCFLAFQVLGQDTVPAEIGTEKVNKNGFRVSYLFNNHQFGIDQEGFFNYDLYTQGIEFAYIRGLSKNINLILPLALGGNTYPASNGTSLNSSETYIGLDAIGQFLITNRNYRLSPYIFAGLGAEYNPYLSEENFSGNIPFGVGLDWNFNSKSSLGARAGYRYGISSDDYAQIAGSYTMMFGGTGKTEEIAMKLSDLDGDGINDDEDECPGEAGTYAFNGCPDTDGDGVADKDDKCPTIFGEIELDGCAQVDSDNDGVADADDACPDVVGTAAAGGCPDSDGDGLADKKDLCPNAFGTIQTNGCPDSDNDGFPDNDDLCPDVVGNVRGCPDSDLDGISDDKDKCPNVAGVLANNGCPAVTTTTTTTSSSGSGTVVDETKLKDVFSRAMTGVQFETASARIKSSSFSILDEIVSLMRQYPGHSLKIGGHTDSIGESGPNQRLSEKRAKACYDYIVKKGITGSRMSYKGFGEKKPIATNKYKDGRKKNRRVEFELWKP